MTAVSRTSGALRVCLWCAVAVAAEAMLYLSYQSHDARFHWLTHFLVGASAALVFMAGWSWRARRPAPLPLIWVLVGHLYAMIPDFLFQAGFAHYRWMEIFLGHVSSHVVPGRNVTWLVAFATALAAYLLVLNRRLSSDA